MADNFDAVEIIYDNVSPYGIQCYKDLAPLEEVPGDEGEHITINSPSGNKSGFATNDINVDINIFVPKTPNGMVNRTRIKTIRTGIKSLIESSGDPDGYYCVIDRGLTGLVRAGSVENTSKAGYDCFVMRYILTLNNT